MAHHKAASYSGSNPKSSSSTTHFHSHPAKFSTNPFAQPQEIDLNISSLRSKYNKSKQERIMTESEITLLKTKIKILTMEEQKISKSTEREKRTSQALKQIKELKRADKDTIHNHKHQQELTIKVKRSEVLNVRRLHIEAQTALKQQSASQHKKAYSFFAKEKEENERLISREKDCNAHDKKMRYLKLKAIQYENQEKRLQEKMSKKREMVKELQKKISNEERIKESLRKFIIKYQSQGIKIVERLGMMANNCTINQIILTNNN